MGLKSQSNRLYTYIHINTYIYIYIYMYFKYFFVRSDLSFLRHLQQEVYEEFLEHV